MQHPSIILATINARYSHAAFGLRWLWANLGPLRDQAVLREFTLSHTPDAIAQALLAESPRLIGFGVYIWNFTLTTQVVHALKSARPDLLIVLGGPEVSYEYEGTPLFASADYLIRGEGEVAFARLAEALLAGQRPPDKVISPAPPDLARLVLPYDAYTDEDLAQRTVYVEASRGCPFRCEFCLSSLELRVREFPLDGFFAAMQRLLDRGARGLKFVDRTFNLDPDRVAAILDFFLARWRDGLQLHFEIVPDRLTGEVLEHMARFPAAGLHLEAGVQTFNPETQAAISRRQNLERTLANLRFLRMQTGALIHADLVAGLPGESWDSFAAGFDRLIGIEPQELQVGILKRLKGAPIARHAAPHAMAFSPDPPYEIIATDRLDAGQIERIKRFAKYFQLFYNTGNFPASLALLWRTRSSRFEAFMAFSDYLWAAAGRTYGLPLEQLAGHFFEYLVQVRADATEVLAASLRQDYHRLPGRSDKLRFLSGAGGAAPDPIPAADT